MKFRINYAREVDARQLNLRLGQDFFPRRGLPRLLLFVALSVAFLCRSIKLISLFPILVDEAIYMRWAEIIQHQHEWFISLLDAKPPLLFWLTAALRPIVGDPLLAHRAVSVVAGCITTVVLYRIGFLCGGLRCGLILACIDAVLPFGVLYDRIGYVDAVVNLCGACIVYASLWTFGNVVLSWRRPVALGLILGVGLFVKTTVVLYAACPLLIAGYLHRKLDWKLGSRLLTSYAIAALFPLWSHFAIPYGPTPTINNTFVHHTNFFTPLGQLIRNPWINAAYNLPLLKAYGSVYCGDLAMSIAFGAFLILLLRRSYLFLLIAAASIGPLLMVSFALTYFPSRYLFPLTWPLLLMIAGGVSSIGIEVKGRFLGSLCAGAIFFSMLARDVRILHAPETALFKDDADEFLGAGAYSGSGVREAVTFLLKEAGGHRATILTDPWWGPPTDAVFAYLNQTNGIEVYEAWWLQSKTAYPLVPDGALPVWRSQYQRISTAAVDFSVASPLYYLTDTIYHSPNDVRLLDSSAVLLRRFPKRNRGEFIDVYRLK